MTMTCAACGALIELPEKVGFRDTCSSCEAWLHSCVNCDFWVNELCTEPSAEKVRDRAGWALRAAELLDPGQPAAAFAAARVRRLEGRTSGWPNRGCGALAIHTGGQAARGTPGR